MALNLSSFHCNRSFKEKNNHSCVLKVSSPGGSILLTGDIEKKAEYYLLKHKKDKLASDILVIPHHGSKTSSTLSFIKAVSPSVAIISAGLDNRYHFPHKTVIERLVKLGVNVKNTSEMGAVNMTI